jgi:hypothetical protein
VTRRFASSWQKITCWLVANALIVQLVLAPIAPMRIGEFDAVRDGTTLFALCTHNDAGLPAGTSDADIACQLCLKCARPALLVPELPKLPSASVVLTPVRWIGLAATVARSRRLERERSRGPPLIA